MHLVVRLEQLSGLAEGMPGTKRTGVDVSDRRRLREMLGDPFEGSLDRTTVEPTD
jgi:hypothetical protein